MSNPSVRDASARGDAASGFLPEIHRLRAIAILMIVGAHCYQCFAWSGKEGVEAVFKDTFDNSSLLFIFVTGFLFQHTEKDRFGYGRYLQRKLRNVIVPFALALVPAIAYALLRSRTGVPDDPFWSANALTRILYYLVWPGETMNYALWFIPVIAVYYLASPLLHAVDRSNAYWILPVLVPLSLLLHRPTYNQGHNLSLAVYFLSAFVLGMAFARHWARLAPWLQRHAVASWIAFGAVFLAHLLLSDHHGKSTTQDPFETQGTEGLIDWIYFQKLLMVVALLAALRRLGGRPARMLDAIAGASFTIFFYHLYFIYGLRWTIQFAPVEFRPGYFLGLLVLSVGPPFLIALAARRLFGDRSRMLVGAA